MSELKDFIEYELKPSIFENVDRLFPEMYFERKPNGDWHSPKKIGGGEPRNERKDKTIISKKHPYSLLDRDGEYREVISYYQQQNKLNSRMDAIKEIAKTLNEELPQGNLSQDYKLLAEKQTSLISLVGKMQKDIIEIPNNKALAYLTNVRGYDTETIKGMGLGYCTAENLKTLFNAVEKRMLYKDNGEFKFPVLQKNISNYVAIPYISNGVVCGIIFRDTENDGKNKYSNVFATETATKKYNLFGLTPLKTYGYTKDIIVVEGELDALRMAYFGFENVVAVSGSSIYVDVVEQAKRKGAERIVLLFDYDKGNEEKTATKIKDSIKTIRSVGGITTLVAEFPKEADKVDADTYLKTHTKEELQTIINNSIDAVSYELFNIFVDNCKDGELSHIKQDKLYRDLVLYTKDLPRYEYAKAFNLLKNPEEISIHYQSFYFDEDLFNEQYNIIQTKKIKDEQQAKTEELLKKAQELNSRGETAQALEELKKVEQITLIDEDRFSKFLDPLTEEDIISQFRSKRGGIPTGYFFPSKDNPKNTVEWELPSGAITIIGATASHGKSRMLQNLAINIAENNNGDILYLSLEESRLDVIKKLVNIKTGEKLNQSGNNFQLIDTYYKQGTKDFVRREKEPKLENAVKQIADYTTSGKIRIISTNEDPKLSYIDEIVDLIRYVNRNTKLQAVFIDYMQLIYSSSKTINRKDNLTNVCNELMNLSVGTGLPIILGAQLNRDATLSPLDMKMQNIADASNIEHAANNIVLLWNSSFKADNSKDNSYLNKRGELTEAAQELERNGFRCGQSGQLFLLLEKNRNGERGLYTILDNDQATGELKRKKNIKNEIIIRT